LTFVSIGGSVTETVYALGAEENLVGTDTSSIFPEAATKLPQVGYQRQLSAEGVISLKPSLVIALPEAGPPAAIQQIESAGIKVLRVNNESTVEGTKTKIRQIAEALNRKEKGEEMIKKLESDLAEAEKTVSSKSTKPKVIFIFSRGAGTMQVSGTNTPADAMIKMAGGVNAVTEFSEYKPLTSEAMVAAAPDVILLPTRGLQTVGGIDAILNLPGVAETPAGKNKKIVSVDDTLLLGFTPRLGQGIMELCEKIH
jgi:iron complex transport system substrate-binding protein